MNCKKIITPGELKEKFSLAIELEEQIKLWRKQINDIIFKKSNKLLVIVGPCSIHDIEQGLDYAKRLKEISSKYENLFVVMRAYFEKPRTSIGWKGLIQDPDLDCSNNIEKGLALARQFLLELTKLGIPAASELLEPLQVKYYEDLLSWGAIGARTAESQVHREMVSGLDFSVGIKNSTDGSVQVAINSMLASSLSHSFLTINNDGQICQLKTKGNKFTHLILRGSNTGPNYDEKSVQQALYELKKANIQTGIMIDASHGNSFKKAKNQPKVIEEIIKQIKSGNSSIIGVMIESNINFGAQKFDPCQDDKSKLEYGVSITDECISLEQTDEILNLLNEI